MPTNNLRNDTLGRAVWDVHGAVITCGMILPVGNMDSDWTRHMKTWKLTLW